MQINSHRKAGTGSEVMAKAGTAAAWDEASACTFLHSYFTVLQNFHLTVSAKTSYPTAEKRQETTH